MTIIYIILGVLGFFALSIIIIGIWKLIDWQAFFIRHYGNDYSKGLAHINIDGTWVYRDSSMIFEGDDAISYSRKTKIRGENIIVEDIVPNGIGFDYDEYTGARVYRVMPGGVIGSSDRGDGPKIDYPAELISCHVLDRTVAMYSKSVNFEPPFNWKPIIIIGGFIIAILIIVGVLFATGTIEFPVNDTVPVTQETENTPESIDPEISGPVQ